MVCSRHLPFLSSFGSLFFLPRKRQCRHTERDSILCYMTLPQFFLSLSLSHTHCPLACRIALFFLHCHFAPFFRCRPILCLVPSWLSVIQSTVVHQHVTQTFCSAQPLQKPYCRDNVYVQQNGAAALHYDCIAGGAVRTEVGRQGPHAVRSFACSLVRFCHDRCGPASSSADIRGPSAVFPLFRKDGRGSVKMTMLSFSGLP